jgi:hypothetical protein
VGGVVGHIIIGGGLFDATVRDLKTGEVCRYQLRCVGVGVDLPQFNVTSKPVTFDDGMTCSSCRDFVGNGYMGGAYAVIGGGVTIGGGTQIPNGPFIPGHLIDTEYGGFRLGVSHNLCYWSLQ